DEAAERTVVVAVTEAGGRPVAELEGYGAVFSPDGGRVAWLRTADPDALARDLEAIRERIPVRTRDDWRLLRQELADARARHARVRVRELDTGRVEDVDAGGPIHAVVWRGGEPVPWVQGADVTLSPTGTHVVFPDDEGLALLTLGTSWQRTFAGSGAPAFSADGSTLVFVTRSEDGYALRRVRLDGADTDLPQTLFRTADEIGGPAVSADGSIVAFQRMGRENREVWILEEGDDEPRRLTHDVQHDLFPTFLAGDRLLVIKGEGRHRRSYVYPVRPDGEPAVREWVPGSGEGMRLFHNNTVRTVAPEYDWAVSPDGTRVLIVADRDGDTISPERGVWLTDLARPVTMAQVRDRVAVQRAAERDLRERGRRLFAPVAAAVREAVAEVSESRLYRYQADLFRFGTKYIGEPGNQAALDYLVGRLREFGYEPELQWFEPRPGIRSANIIARVPGTVEPDVVYLVSSHFDSNRRSPGADDNTSATVALLETARIMADRPQAATMEFAFFTAEEAGLLGSREYARRALEEGKNVAGAINNDMVGYANDHRLDNTIRYSSAAVRDLQHAAAFLFTDLILYDAHYYRSTDAHALYDAFGDVIGGIGSYPILASPHYHLEHDVLETINHRLVTEVTKTTIASILRLAAGPPLASSKRRSAPPMLHSSEPR
ncbi:MAG: M28 family peptidase, partial [Gemmatimonadota bacterium]